MNLILVAVSSAALAAARPLVAHSPEPLAGLLQVPAEQVERRVAAMGTALRMQVEAPQRRPALLASEAALRAIEDAEQRLSTWREDSVLSRLNADGRGRPDAATASELRQALRWAERTDQAFDPTCGALVDLWNLRGQARRPAPEELASTLATVDPAHLRLHPDGTIELDAGTRVEEGAWGKGAGLDRALEALGETDATSATLDLGGQLAWFGAGERTLEIAHPDRRDEVAVRLEAPLWCVSAATSGNSERSLVVDGERLGHLLDPRTGQPAQDFGSVTVLARGALMADALATGFYVLGPDRSLEIARTLDGVEAVFLERDGDALRLTSTDGIHDAVRLLSPTGPPPTERSTPPSSPDSDSDQ